MAPRRVALPAVQQPGRTWVQDEPLGTVLILGPVELPVDAGVAAAGLSPGRGNTAVLKPSEQAPAVAQLLAEMVPRHFEADVVRVELGGAETAQALPKQPFDHVVFTGGTTMAAR